MQRLILSGMVVFLLGLPLCSCATPTENDAMEYIEQMQSSDYFQQPEQIALAEAIAAGDSAAIKAAVANGVDVNAVGKLGMTPLFWAMIKQQYSAFTLLLEIGANPNITTKMPEHFTQDEVNSIGLAAEMKDPRYLELLLKHGGNPDVLLTQWERTPIYDAIMRRNLDTIKLLLEHGADINHQSKSGVTPLMEAVSASMYKIALFLLHSGADPTIKDRWGGSPVDVIEQFGDAGIDRRTGDLAAYDEFVQELKKRGLLTEEPPRTR